MRFEIVCLLALVVIFAHATVDEKDDKDRFLLNASTATISFSTFTIIKRSTTITSTLTSTTTCTTSTAALTTCTIGRRRRGLFYDEAASQGRNRRGLFYNDEEVEDKQGSTFLATDKKASDPVNEVPAFKTAATDEQIIPLEVQAGFSLPAGQEGNRFLLAFGTSTITSYVVTSSTISLTAFCSSTTGFALCGNVGK